MRNLVRYRGISDIEQQSSSIYGFAPWLKRDRQAADERHCNPSHWPNGSTSN
jgi:hypothetical protein